MDEKEINKLNKLSNKYHSKYNVNDKLKIYHMTKTTIRYIEKNIMNIPKEYMILRNRIIDTSYKIMEGIIRANIFQDKEDKKAIIVDIQLLNFYLDEARINGVLTDKKFYSYSKYLLQIDKMVRTWINYEKSW